MPPCVFVVPWLLSYYSHRGLPMIVRESFLSLDNGWKHVSLVFFEHCWLHHHLVGLKGMRHTTARLCGMACSVCGLRSLALLSATRFSYHHRGETYPEGSAAHAPVPWPNPGFSPHELLPPKSRRVPTGRYGPRTKGYTHTHIYILRMNPQAITRGGCLRIVQRGRLSLNPRNAGPERV